MTAIVLPYTNPDLDGVACAIALSSLYEDSWHAHIVGDIDDETDFVLAFVELNSPEPPPKWTEIDEIWLVDTHHPKQIPTELPKELVTEITDHHPGGSPEQFPNARIENEQVGAAATLVAERYFREKRQIEPKTAILLQAAILSNTLSFKAPATSDRDHSVYARLQAVQKIPPELVEGMAGARSSILEAGTTEILESDTKTFEGKFGGVIIAQIEADNSLQLLNRPDLNESLEQLTVQSGTDSAVLVLVDTFEQSSAVLTTNPALNGAIAKFIGVDPDANGIIRPNRLLQRKSDILPVLK